MLPAARDCLSRKWHVLVYAAQRFTFVLQGFIQIPAQLQRQPEIGEVPKNLLKRRAVLGVMPRRPLTISLMRW